jgi:hypothetical protein
MQNSGTIWLVFLCAVPLSTLGSWCNCQETDEEAAARQNRLERIGLAIHEYMLRHKEMRFPRPAIYGKDGKPLLSWRVLILPYLDEEALFNQFSLTDSWDSESNRKLVDKMPTVYSPIGIGQKQGTPNRTYIQLFVGPGTCFDYDKGYTAKQLLYGLGRTVFAAEGSSLVPWTKPADIEFDKNKPLPKLGGFFKTGFHILVGDGTVRFVKHTFNEEIMKQGILRKSPDLDNRVDLNDLDR